MKDEHEASASGSVKGDCVDEQERGFSRAVAFRQALYVDDGDVWCGL